MAFIDSTKFRFTFSRLWSPTQTEDSGQQKADSRRRITLLWAGTDREQLPRTLPWPLLVACHSCLCYYPCCRCCCCCLFIIICTENVRSGCAFFIAFFDIVLLAPFYFYLFLVAPLSVSFYTRLRECVCLCCCTCDRRWPSIVIWHFVDTFWSEDFVLLGYKLQTIKAFILRAISLIKSLKFFIE